MMVARQFTVWEMFINDPSLRDKVRQPLRDEYRAPITNGKPPTANL
jgi:hypothetical protein